MKKILVLFTLSLLAGIYSSQSQTNMFWDANGTSGGLGGTGNWTATGSSWATNNSSGTASVGSGAWSSGNGNIAIFQGTAGNVTLSSASVSAGQVQVNTTGYTFSNNSTTSGRYIRATNGGIFLGNNVNMNISSAITTNGSVTGLQGPVTNAVGASGTSLTVTGTTLNSDSSVRIGFDGSETDIWVPLIIATTGSGYASLKNVGGTNSIYNTVTVNSGSRLTFGASSSTRRINVRGNLSTVNTDLTIGESGDVGMIVLYGNNSIGGNVLLKFGQLGYGTNNTAFGSATIVISDGTSFGQQGTIGTTDADRTIANNLSLQGNVTMGLGSFSSYIGGNVDLNGAVRTVTLGNTTYFNGAVTNGGLTIASSSATRVLYLNGTNTLSSLSWTQGVVAFGTATNQIASLTMSNTTNGNPTLLVLNPTNGVDTRGAINLIGTNLVLALNNPSNTLSYGTYSLLKKGSSFNTNNLSPDGLSLRITHVTGSQTNVTTNQLNGPSVTYQKYIYTFTETANSLNLIADVNPSMDLTWSPGLVADWNTNSIDGLANPPWSNSGAPSAFRSGDNAIIDQGGTLNVDTNGITSSYVKVSGANDTTIQGGSVNALLVSKYDAGVLKLGGDLSSTQGIDLYGGTLQTLGDEDVGDTTALRFVSNNVTFRLGGNERVASLDSASTVTNALVDLVTFNLVLGSTNSNATNTFYGSIQGSGNVTKTGVNMQLLRGSNAFNNLIIEQGSLYVRGSNSIASNVIVQSNGLLGFGGTNVASGNYFGPSANLILSNGATLAQIATNGSGTVADRWIPNPIKIQGNVTFGIGTFANYYSGSIDLGGQVRTLSLSNSTYFSGIVSNGGLTVAPSTLRLYLNSSNTYGGGTTMQGAQISLGNNDGLGTGTLTVNASVSTNNLTVSANLTSSNPITLDPGAILELDSSSFSWTHSGSVGGSGSILKRGTGTLNLTGTLNYSGSTTVAAGNLVRTTDNISASITPSTIAITFSNTPANGTYAVLPGALSGMYTATYNNLSSSQKATFSTESPASVTVASKSSQSITDLASTDTKTYGAAPYTLSVTPGASSSSLTFSSDNSSVATVSSEGLVTIQGAGSTTIRVNQPGDADYLAAAEVTQALTVNTKALTVTGLAGANKEYDGGTTASATGTASLSGVISADTANVTLDGTPAFSFATATVGTGKTITTTGYTLGGSASGNYSLTQPSLTANITAKGLTIGGLSVSNKVYDGTNTVTVTGTANYVGLVTGETFDASTNTVTWAFADANVGTAKSLTRTGSYAAPSGNYSVTQPTLAADITARALTVTAEAKSKTANTSDPSLTYLVTSGSLVSADSFTGALTRDSGESAGTYAIKQGTLSAGSNYAITYVGANLTINSAGPTFESAYSGVNLTDVAPNGLTYLVNYAFGGSASNAPKLPMQDTNDPTKLKLVAFVRTNDVSAVPITVKGQVGSSLSSWDSTLIDGVPASDNNGAPEGTQKQIFSVDVSGDRQFLRLQVTK